VVEQNLQGGRAKKCNVAEQKNCKAAEQKNTRWSLGGTGIQNAQPEAGRTGWGFWCERGGRSL
jgi:hypothetical protein